MSDWNHPDIRKHVSGDITDFRISQFLEPNIFYNESSKKYSPYVLKHMYNRQNLIYNSVNSEKLDKYTIKLQEDSPQYTFAATSNYKPMQDSFYAMGETYLYQIILAVNKLWNILDYNDNNLPKILVPTNDDIYEMFRSLLRGCYHRNMQELSTPENIRDAIEKVINNIDTDYDITNIISAKLYDNPKEIAKRLKSPLITKYLCVVLSKLINDTYIFNDELLNDKLNEIFRKLAIYIRDNSVHQDD